MTTPFMGTTKRKWNWKMNQNLKSLQVFSFKFQVLFNMESSALIWGLPKVMIDSRDWNRDVRMVDRAISPKLNQIKPWNLNPIETV